MEFNNSLIQRLSARHKRCLNIAEYKDKKILDIGSSFGWFEKLSQAKEIFAIDINQKDLEDAKNNNKENKTTKLTFKQLSVLDLDKLPSSGFDSAVMFDVVEHIPENTEIEALKKIKSKLKPGGKFILSTPAQNFSKFFDIAWYFGHRHYTEHQLKHIFKKAGFKIIHMETRGGFFELLSMILFYPFKHLFNSEIPFKSWFDKKRDSEYLNKTGYVTHFIIGEG